jgi:hypothetical protein
MAAWIGISSITGRYVRPVASNIHLYYAAPREALPIQFVGTFWPLFRATALSDRPSTCHVTNLTKMFVPPKAAHSAHIAFFHDHDYIIITTTDAAPPTPVFDQVSHPSQPRLYYQMLLQHQLQKHKKTGQD